MAGCASPVSLEKLKYASPASVKSNKTVLITVEFGQIGGEGGSSLVPVGGVPISMRYKAVPELWFKEADQTACVQALRQELVRIGVVGLATENKAVSADLHVNLNFVKTSHNLERQSYALDVDMGINGGGKTISKLFKVTSEDKRSTWNFDMSTAYENKAKACSYLIEKLVPEIETFIAKY
jgi:hypothetical protein